MCELYKLNPELYNTNKLDVPTFISSFSEDFGLLKRDRFLPDPFFVFRSFLRLFSLATGPC